MTDTAAAGEIEILFKQVSKAFGDRPVLRDLNLEIPKRQSIVILGRSGSGKSVMLKHITGALRPDSGEVLVKGRKPDRALMEIIGVLFQQGALFDSMKVWENITFSLRDVEGWNARQAQDFAVYLLEQVDLAADVAQKYPRDLSGGMAKRVALARAVSTRPEILLCDEPTTGLDPVSGLVIDTLIRRLVDRFNMTCFTITHDLASAQRIADRLVLLSEGRIAWDGPPEAFATTDNPAVVAYRQAVNQAHV
jgi:phospholipid/cholesterol/gamma-HCH transport system ATP-binding protein